MVLILIYIVYESLLSMYFEVWEKTSLGKPLGTTPMNG
jgi:hypothetical protein